MDLDTTEATEEAFWADTMAADTLEEYITTEAYIAEVSAEGDDLVHVFLTL